MQKSVEALLVVAALFLALFLGRTFWRRHGPGSGRPATDPGLHPGTDAGPGRAGSVTELPMIKLNSSPRPARRKAAVPPPAAIK